MTVKLVLRLDLGDFVPSSNSLLPSTKRTNLLQYVGQIGLIVVLEDNRSTTLTHVAATMMNMCTDEFGVADQIRDC